ncbi:MAG: HAMP domain-containing sensor histidine kinase [Alphaproteobacteria bacterium]|nr:HAMP domain-containing sensor histidine kinase [Alphaproteobacteria bacterium]
MPDLPKPVHHHLWLKIWVSVVAVVVVIMLLASVASRFLSDPPIREVVARNPLGSIVAHGRALLLPPDGLPEGKRKPSPGMEGMTPGLYGPGPEFLLTMDDGEWLHVHIPRPPRTFWSLPNGLLWTLLLAAVAVAIGSYPIIRQLTRRLENLERAVTRWGDGDLSARMPVQGQDEVASLTHRFNQAAEKMQGLVLSHKNLLANASHEFRTPITRMRMALELQAQRPDHHLQKEILRDLEELDQLVEEVLLASRLDQVSPGPNLGMDRVDMAGLASEECSRCEISLEMKDALQLQVQGVDRLLRRMLRNLLDNALRHGSPAAEVVMQLTPTHDGLLRIEVLDRGPGVPEMLRDKIFEPFFRVPDQSEWQGGTGLGLTLVRSIARHHGGEVSCEARPGGGACFMVELPLAA